MNNHQNLRSGLAVLAGFAVAMAMIGLSAWRLIT